MRVQRRKVSVSSLLVSGVIAAGLLALAWFLLSPLFIDEVVDEGFPTAPVATQPSEAVIAVTATAAMRVAMAKTPTAMDEPMPGEAALMTLLAQGNFYSVAHAGEGMATIYELPDGARFLRFENFVVLNGPQLHVYLTSATPITDTVGIELPNSIDLGPLKGNLGDQNYTIPPGLDLSAYQSVVIWCVPFRVAFNAAPLATP